MRKHLLAVLVAILAGCTPSLYQEWGHHMDMLTRQNGRVGDVSLLLGSPPTRCDAVTARYLSIGTSLQAQRLVVHSVIPGGPAEQAGLHPGDTITSVAGQPVANPEDVSSAVRRHARDGQPLELGTSRGNFTLLPKAPKAEQCYWDVQAGQVSRSDQRSFRASCRVNDGFLSTCEWN
jgi:membrane-associated protease RseP (regulator of RpoE activity)